MWVAHAPGMSGTFSPTPPRVSGPDMHYDTCVTHVPWCMSGSLTRGFHWSRWRGKRSRHSRRMRNPQFYVSGKRPIGEIFLMFTTRMQTVPNINFRAWFPYNGKHHRGNISRHIRNWQVWFSFTIIVEMSIIAIWYTRMISYEWARLSVDRDMHFRHYLFSRNRSYMAMYTHLVYIYIYIYCDDLYRSWKIFTLSHAILRNN